MVVVSTQRIDVPLLICATATLLYVRPDDVGLCTPIGLTKLRRLTAEPLPMRQPRAAVASRIRCTVDIPEFHCIPLRPFLLAAQRLA